MTPEGSAEYVLPVTDGGVIRLSPHLRERYLTPETDQAVVQATGYQLSIRIWSDRSNICICLPMDEYRSERPYQRSINSWGINVNRWVTPGKRDDPREDPMWNNEGVLDIGYGSESQKQMIEAWVHTFDGVKPEI